MPAVGPASPLGLFASQLETALKSDHFYVRAEFILLMGNLIIFKIFI